MAKKNNSETKVQKTKSGAFGVVVALILTFVVIGGVMYGYKVIENPPSQIGINSPCGHNNYGEWQVILQPTFEKEGKTARVCKEIVNGKPCPGREVGKLPVLSDSAYTKTKHNETSDKYTYIVDKASGKKVEFIVKRK